MHLRQFYGATFLATALTSVAAELALDVDLDLGILDLDVNISVDAELSKNKYDFVIVGSGAGGSVLANRLSANPTVKVLLLEAGPSNQDLMEPQIPFLCATLTPNTPIDWNYTTTAQSGFDGRSIPYPRGRLLGGSTSVNYMVYTRASSDDFDRYAAVTGDDGWNWDNMQQYFLKNERWTEPNDGRDTSGQYDPTYHSSDGMTSVSLAGYPSSIQDRVIDAANEYQGIFSFNMEQNSGNPLGLGYMQSTIKGPARDSGATSYLSSKVLKRKNLDVLVNAEVSRVLQSNMDSTEPEFKTVEFKSPDGRMRTITANKEVILSAGAIGTPHILLNSGIGKKVDVEAAGLTSIVDLPDVGYNLQDHIYTMNSFAVADNNTYDIFSQSTDVQKELLGAWENGGDSQFMVDSPLSHLAFVHLADDSPALSLVDEDPAAGENSPHYEVFFANGLLYPEPTGNYLTLGTAVVSPTSRGSVTLSSSDPFAAPNIDVGALTTDFDKAVLLQAVKDVREFLKADAWSGYIQDAIYGLADANTDEDIAKYISGNSYTVFHPTSTAAMSKPDAENGVVNPDLLVKKVSGLRIVDASVFPYVPSAHTMAPVYAFAERASDIIKAKYWI